MVELVGRGSVIKWAYPIYFSDDPCYLQGDPFGCTIPVEKFVRYMVWGQEVSFQISQLSCCAVLFYFEHDFEFHMCKVKYLCIFIYLLLFDRPGVAGAVRQTALSEIN